MMLIQNHGQGEWILWEGERGEFTLSIAAQCGLNQEEYAAIAALPPGDDVEFPQEGIVRRVFYWVHPTHEVCFD